MLSARMATLRDPFLTPCTYVDSFSGGLTRQRQGERFRYVTATGKPVRSAATIARLDAIALPPAYQQAWYCPSPRGHIQATGMDARGRRQYRYHPAYRAAAEEQKFSALAAFGRALPRIRRQVEADLAQRGLPRDRVIAALVRLLDTGHIRIGNRAYAASNRSYGATTLRTSHARVGRDRLKLEFTGKSGKLQSITILDRRLVTVVRQCSDLPGQQLFQYVDDEGVRHPVDSGDVNAWLGQCCGDFTAKMFRTWHASVIAFAALAEADGAARIKAVLDQVSMHLGNTPAVARKSYVHPALIALMSGERAWDPRWSRLPRAAGGLSRAERGFLAFLDDMETAEREPEQAD